MLAACSMVNLTAWRAARTAHAELARRYRTPERLSRAAPADLEPTLRPLGLWRRRSRSLVAMAAAYAASPPRTARDVLRLPGCGTYAADSWAIFVDGRTDVRPADHYLSRYLEGTRAVDPQ